MNTVDSTSLVHRVAVATTILALLPIGVGALVTTLDAGMAFRDWPSSDGHNLFFYPWLKSVGEKFIEHGHRLAGALIGFVSIGLAVLAWTTNTRPKVRWAATGVLAAVIVQGLLGGGRVRLDERALAMVHGSFAALVFALMAGVAHCTSRAWLSAEERHRPLAPRSLRLLKWFAYLLPVCLFLQSLLGGLVRHFGRALHEHLAGAIFVTILVTATTLFAHRSQVPWLKRAGWLTFGCLLLQVGLGLGAWVMKFGFPPAGYVAVINSLPHVAFRTAHTVSGTFLFASACLLALKTWRVSLALSGPDRQQTDAQTLPQSGGSLSWEGGVR